MFGLEYLAGAASTVMDFADGAASTVLGGISTAGNAV